MSAENHLRDRTVQSMFDRIAGRYDLLNRVISFRLDAWWRRQVIKAVLTHEHPCILDIGTGTGDLVFDAAKTIGGNGRFVGLDFSLRMLQQARLKQAKISRGSAADFVMGSAMAAPFKDNAFDGAMSAFVLRNVSDLTLLFAEAFRVLKPGAKFVSVDMFPPSAGWFLALYSVYFHGVMPRIGAWLARDRDAYEYLSNSVRRFHPPERVTTLIEQAGFKDVTVRKYLRGAVCMHVADKPRPTTARA
jgi:demethylmenaquinone methyltransferase/2-methoxy-6-polyprenyl-1,4-benzoquinol methylase